MAVDLSRRRALQELTSQRQRHKQTHTNTTTSRVPALFQLAVQACVSHLQIFATLEGLPFHPFGQALYEEFARRATQWRLTTEQRQAGIILFAEAYGSEFLGPEYTGLRCSLSQDVPFLSSFAGCLVYLDLSGGCACAANSRRSGGRGDIRGNNAGSGTDVDDETIGFTDGDMAGLSSLSHLRILNLAHLRIGDTGLGHLIRSVAFGSSGPSKLEYLNLSGTDVTDVGLAKLFDKQPQQKQQRYQHTSGRPRLVFKRLLGIDITDSRVHDEIAETLFQTTTSDAVWWRLSDETQLFADLTTKEQKAASVGKTRYYVEQDSDMNPMQRWVDRFHRTYKLSFGQRPNLEGEDGLGLAESLALSKLGQVYIYPVPEPVSRQQQEYVRRGEEFRVKRLMRRTREDESYVRMIVEVAREFRKPKNARPNMPDLEHMFNLTMYQRVLESVRLTFGTKHHQTSAKRMESECKRRLAFVRERSDMENHEETESDSDEEDQSESAPMAQPTSGVRSIDGVLKAKIRTRRDRPIVPSVPKWLAEVQQLSVDLDSSQLESTPSLSTPFSKKGKASTTSPFTKQQETLNDYQHLPGRRRNYDGSNYPRLLDQPFVKPISEQTHTDIFIKQPTVHAQPPTASSSIAPSYPQKRPAASSSLPLMDRWIQQGKPAAKVPVKLTPLPGKKRRVSDVDHGSKTFTRKIQSHETNKDTVSLDRWIRSGTNTVVATREDDPPRKVIRFDPKHEMFADDNESSVECKEHGE